MRNRTRELSSMEKRIAQRNRPHFTPTDEQIEKAGEAARSAYRGAGDANEVARWEIAAEAALRTIELPPPRECTCSDGQICTVCTPTQEGGEQ